MAFVRSHSTMLPAVYLFDKLGYGVRSWAPGTKAGPITRRKLLCCVRLRKPAPYLHGDDTRCACGSRFFTIVLALDEPHRVRKHCQTAAVVARHIGCIEAGNECTARTSTAKV